MSEARASLPELLHRVEDGEEIAITRHGRSVAVVVRPDALRTRRAEVAWGNAERVREMLATARSAPRPSGGLTAGRAEQLVREVRAGREGG